jgi:LPXTG-motif cell wall-anchored protein
LSSKGSAIGDTDTPLGAGDILGDAAAQQGGMEPWAAAVVIGVLVLVLAAALWLILRRRRRPEGALADE